MGCANQLMVINFDGIRTRLMAPLGWKTLQCGSAMSRDFDRGCSFCRHFACRICFAAPISTLSSLQGARGPNGNGQQCHQSSTAEQLAWCSNCVAKLANRIRDSYTQRNTPRSPAVLLQNSTTAQLRIVDLSAVDEAQSQWK